MSDTQQAPVIQLDIDQALFIDFVRKGDAVEDATVATEVTSLDRADDAYVLQGTIVLSGRLSHTGDSDVETVSQVQLEHRLPFQLRVAAKSQPRGIVNVASRIANCRFDVVDDHWIRMEGDLQVSGLNGRDGFHFQCGSQEFGNLYSIVVDDVPQSTISETVDAATQTESASASFDLQTADAQGEFQLPFNHDDEPTIEFIPPLLHDVKAASLSSDNVPSSKDLVDFDRALDGQSAFARQQEAQENQEQVAEFRSTGETDVDIVSTGASAEPPAEQAPVSDPTAIAHDNQRLESFEFEHQVSADEMLDDVQPVRADAPSDALFSASRSFAEDRFVPHVGFTGVPDEALRGEATVSPTVEVPDLDEVAETSVQSHAPNTTNLWSFVDFNQPEQRYTLRYVVVMEDETLQTVADRLRCKVPELMAVNHLKTEDVFVGQTLRVPSSVVHLAMIN